MTNDTLGLYGPEDSKYLRLVARRDRWHAHQHGKRRIML